MKIKTHLLLYLVPPICLMLALLTWMNYRNASEQAAVLARMEVDLLASVHSAKIFDKIQHAEAAVSSLASALKEISKSRSPDREVHSSVVRGVAESSPDFFGVWALWEPNAFDGRDADFVGDDKYGNTDGQANAYWLREGGTLVYNVSENYRDKAYYTLPMQAGRLAVIPPYRDMETTDQVLMTTITMPMVEDGRVLGVAGIDIELTFIHGLIKNVRPYGSGYVTLVTDQGIILTQAVGKSGSEALSTVDAAVAARLGQGKAFVVEERSKMDGASVQSFYVPIKLESFPAPWFFVVSLPMDKVMAESRDELKVEVAISAAALLLLIGLVFLTAGKVSRPVERIARYAKEVAAGNHNANVNSKGFVCELTELQSALQSMLDSLLRTMHEAEERKREAELEAERAREATDEAEKAKAAAEEATRKGMHEAAFKLEDLVQETRDEVMQVDASMRMITDGAENQKSYAAETATAMLQMSTAITEVAKNAADAFDSAEQAREHAASGAGIVGETIQAISDVNDRARNIAEAMARLEDQAQSITSVMNVISDIADQTNLLALNAAIEAARAGDAGRGFAVVADEVRKLAEKTMYATQEVAQVTRAVQQSTGENIRAVEEALCAVTRSTEMAQKAGEALETIVRISEISAEKIHTIATASEEQSATSEQILKSTEGVKIVAEENSARMAEANTHAQAIDALTRQINQVVEELKNM